MPVWRLVWAQLVRRGSRSLALGLGLLVACAGFTVLTAQSTASRLQVRATVNANARAAYDILVRPKGAASPLETQDGLVQAGYLAGNQGGISVRQWRRIQRITGVEVAAPVAVLGYVVPRIAMPVFDKARVHTGSRRVLLRLETTWSTDGGLTKIQSRPTFVYVTPHKLVLDEHEQSEVTSSGKTVFHRGEIPVQWVVQGQPTVAAYVTTHEYTSSRDSLSGLDPEFSFPFLLEAIDPASEAKLSGLDSALVSGKYLTASPAKGVPTSGGGSASSVPVLVASRPGTQQSVSYRVVQLPTSAADAVGAGAGVDSQLRTKGRTIATGTEDQDAAYKLLIGALHRGATTDAFAREMDYVYRVGPIRYAVRNEHGSRVLRPQTTSNRRRVWADPPYGYLANTLIPAGADDMAFRQLTGYKWSSGVPPILTKRGVFDPSRLPEQSSLSAVPLGTYVGSVLTGATGRERRVLGNNPLPTSPNIAGYPQPAPLMLTSLSALGAYQEPAPGSSGYLKMSGDRDDAPFAPVAPKPLSSVRVRVAGVTGVDAVSRERVRLVAQRIIDLTGLRVDITVGSSPSPQRIDLPAGVHGRPALALSENWVKKGTALAILKSVDKKSVALFVLVLVVCGLFVGNAAAASVRARRREMGMLACLGWRRSRLFTLVMVELAVIAVCAGLGGALVAYATGAALHIPVSLGRAGLAVPAALLVALVAGAIPAKIAADAAPLEAVGPSAQLSRRGREPRSVLGLAWVNVTRTRARSALAATGFAVAVSALTVITGILTAFKGAVVGTLLGDAVTTQVRTADYLAVAAILVLAAIGVANVMFMNIRERGTELATLRALGWTEPTLAGLLLVEGLLIGLAGAVTGAVLGAGVLVFLLGAPSTALVWTTLGAAATGLVMNALASLGPALSISRLPTAQLLNEE